MMMMMMNVWRADGGLELDSNCCCSKDLNSDLKSS